MPERQSKAASPSMDEIAARAAATDKRAEALGLDVRLAVTNARSRRAFFALLRGDDGGACRALDALDAEQLQQIENAAVALSLHAARVRATLPNRTEETR